MHDPNKAPATAHESACEANTTPPSTHDDTTVICAGQGRTDQVHNRTVFHTTDSDAIQTPTTKRFCTFAVNTGLTDSPGLPPELRLRVYKAAFPEMDRPVVDEKAGSITDPQLVFIGTWVNFSGEQLCQGECKNLDKDGHSMCHFGCADCRSEDEMCVYCADQEMCDVCADPRPIHVGRVNRLREVFTSNFARDPTIRVEFLTEYLRQVRFYKKQSRHIMDLQNELYLWRFLSVLDTADLIVELKHLTIEPVNHASRHDVGFWGLWIGSIFAILFSFRVKLELSLDRTPPTYKPVLDRITEITKTNLSRDTFDEFYQFDRYDQTLEKRYFDKISMIFLEDRILKELEYRFEQVQKPHPWKGYLCHDNPLRYPIDFSV